MSDNRIGELREAGVLENEKNEAALVIQGDKGAAVVDIPEDQAIPFRDTVRELVRHYDEDQPAPSDNMETIGHE